MEFITVGAILHLLENVPTSMVRDDEGSDAEGRDDEGETSVENHKSVNFLGGGLSVDNKITHICPAFYTWAVDIY